MESRFFERPRFLEPPDNSNQTPFPLDLISVEAPSISRTPDFSNFRFLEPVFFSLGNSKNRDSTVVFFLNDLRNESKGDFKIPLSQVTNRQNKHRKTKLNNMAVLLRVFISFLSVLRVMRHVFFFSTGSASICASSL